jgi:hypothetical protein
MKFTKLTFTIQPFKSHISAVAGAVFNLNAYCRMVFSFFHEKDVHLMGLYCDICPLAFIIWGWIFEF